MRSIAERHQYILEQIQLKGHVKVLELSEALHVSEVTIRKDLKHLEGRKMLYRNHGSASSMSSIINDRHIDVKEKMNQEEKSGIACVAGQFVEENDKIIIASGTTLLALADALSTIEFPITVITSSVKVSLTLCYNPNIEVIQLGGIMRKNSVSIIGHYADNILESLSCNKLFLGVDGIDLDYGLTTSNMSEARINQQMIDASQEIIVLTDSSKFGKRGFCKICDIDKVHHIITDKNAPSRMIEQLREKEIKVTLV
ncbi:DeoR/GlpR family DNA-binding transcription regulator [Massilibacteroides sp.]|uniref:DeoR/GlpR family DNA-binding transcription regulator n=1 Tax=Massilibacteroides sp. TaxID=2034766 RepID=UPI002611BFAB|nr:DeoR/GlpR family DNA-binding transcription regulator [Massilibacteroides sp.]MDD4514072.1 DeoR/GlpR family DNA-binding transcription regulator [Massilibacteroides sp.]